MLATEGRFASWEQEPQVTREGKLATQRPKIKNYQVCLLKTHSVLVFRLSILPVSSHLGKHED